MTTPGDLSGIRVLVLFGGAHFYGQERANIEVMRTLRERGAEIFVITDERHAGGEVEGQLARLGFPFSSAQLTVHWHYAIRRPRYFLFNLKALVSTARELVRQARRWKPTHLYVMNWGYFASGFFGFRTLRLPLIFRAGDLLPDHSIFHRWISRQLLRRADLTVCNSQFLARDMKRIGVSRDRLRVICNHPPLRDETTAAESTPAKPGGVTFLFIGQVARHKGIFVLVDAVREMIRMGNDVALLIAGGSPLTDPQLDRLKGDIAGREFAQRIVFLGARQDVAQLFRQSDVHVCPSLFEDPSPNVILEAKRAGVPSVAFPVGGIPELIEHEIDGFLCRETSRQALIEGLAFFAQNSQARQAAGLAARQSYETTFGFPRFQREWVEVFRDTMPSC